MLVELPTITQAARVASTTRWPVLPGEKPGSVSRRLDAGGCFEDHRAAVEAVSVLFKLFDLEGCQVESGWRVSAARFEVEWPDDRSVVRSHFGARRKAYNWALGQVKADLDARRDDPSHVSVDWNLGELRKEWNRQKDIVAPWWAENSKECYSSGIADLAVALTNWSKSKSGKRKGRRVGFPRFNRKGRSGERVRFTTGTMRLAPDRRTIVLPVIGALRSKENTRRVQRRAAKGDARILHMTLSERWGRLFVSVCYAERIPGRKPVSKPGVRAGVDVGVRTLATVADTDGNVGEVPNPAALRATLTERRRAGRQLSRRIPGSVGHSQAEAKGNGWNDVFNIPMTAHFIGGAVIGDSPATGVIDPYHRVYGYPGLHVVDGAAVSANLGVNPSLTITAQAERAMSFWPNKGQDDTRPAPGSPYDRIRPIAPVRLMVPDEAPAALRLGSPPEERFGD